MNIKYRTNFEISVLEIDTYLSWWSWHTHEERRMVPRSVEYFKANLLFSVFASDESNGDLIGAAGLFRSYDTSRKNWIKWEERQIVELGSNFVMPSYRERHVATKFVQKRLNFAREKNFFPVTVTGNLAMQKVLQGIALPVEELDSKYLKLHSLIRDCNCKINEKPDCKVCPLADRVLWAFTQFL